MQDETVIPSRSANAHFMLQPVIPGLQIKAYYKEYLMARAVLSIVVYIICGQELPCTLKRSFRLSLLICRAAKASSTIVRPDLSKQGGAVIRFEAASAFFHLLIQRFNAVIEVAHPYQQLGIPEPFSLLLHFPHWSDNELNT